MKILARLVLSGFFLFAAAGVVPLCAQHYRGMLPDSYQKLRDYDSVGVKSDEQDAIENLEKRCQQLETKIHDLQAFGTSNDDLEMETRNLKEEQDRLKTQLQNLETEIQDVDDRLNRTKLDLATTMGTIFTLEHGRVPWNPSYAAPPAGRPASKPKAAVSKPKAPASQPAPGANQAKSSVNKPKPTVKEGTH